MIAGRNLEKAQQSATADDIDAPGAHTLAEVDTLPVKIGSKTELVN